MHWFLQQSFQFPFTSFLLDPNIFLSTLFSDALNIYSSHSLKDFVALYILTFMFFRQLTSLLFEAAFSLMLSDTQTAPEFYAIVAFLENTTYSQSR
jgi:hypothetical protein